MHLSLAGPGAIAFNWVTARQGGASSVFWSLGRRVARAARTLGKYHCKGVSSVQYGFASGDYTGRVDGRAPACYSVGDYDSGVLHEVIVGRGAEGPLPANATVYFRVSGAREGVWGEESSFVTPPPLGVDSLPYRSVDCVCGGWGALLVAENASVVGRRLDRRECRAKTSAENGPIAKP